MSQSFTNAAENFETSSVSDFWSLLKPRVMSLVVFSAFCGLVVAPGAIHPVIAFIAILCIAAGAGAAGAINMWYERDIDALMKRTANRPLPKGRIAPTDALFFGVVVSAISVILMAVAVNFTAAAMLLVSILFYVFIYTIWLKRRTPQNIVIGGAAGAFPPVIGWAAVTGTLDPGAWAMFLIIFLWTPPHFWALSLFCSDDYKRANIPMLPVVSGQEETKRQIFIYTVFLTASTYLPYVLGTSGVLYVGLVSVLNIIFFYLTIRVLADNSKGADKKLFSYSILYLFLLFLGMMAEKVIKGAV